MSQSWQQPQQPDGYPPQQQGGYPPQQPGGYPPQQPGGYPQQQAGYSHPAQQQPGGYPQQQQQQFGGGYPPPAPAPVRRGNPALAILAGVVATVVMALLYALLFSAMNDWDDTEFTKLGYAGVAVGLVIGLAMTKVGGRNPMLWVIAAVLALVGVVLGDLYGYAMVASDAPGAPSSMDIFFNHFSDLWRVWKESQETLNYIFFILAPAAALSVSYRMSNSQR